MIKASDIKRIDQKFSCMEEKMEKCAGEIRRYDSLESTNKTARQWIKEGAPHGGVVVCETQTMGRGRRGRQWESPKGKGLWMSMVLRPNIAQEDFPLLTFAAALAAADACRSQGAEVSVKWPNDLVLCGKKVCGILCEKEGEAAVAGIGLNVKQKKEDFPPELWETAASLEMQCEKPFDREKLLLEIQSGLEEYCRLLEKNPRGLWEIYRPRCITLGAPVRVQAVNETYVGVAEDVNEWGELMVRLEDGSVKTVTAGDVSVRGLMGYAG